MFGLLFLHFFLYGCNIFMWRKTRINYSFIFELATTKELKYRDVFVICTTSMAVVVGVMFIHLSLTAKGYSSTQIQAIPGILLLVTSPSFLFNFLLRNNNKYLNAIIQLQSTNQVWSLLLYSYFLCYLCAPSIPYINQAGIVFFAF